jgi:predicted ester cyclase
MSEENKAIARRYILDVWGKGDYETEQAIVAANVVDHNPVPGFPPGLTGHHQTLAMLHNAMPDMKIDLAFLVAEGDKVLDHWSCRATHAGEFFGIPSAGKPVMFTGTDISRIADGKIVEIWHIEDVLSIMQQIGVIPAPG